MCCVIQTIYAVSHYYSPHFQKANACVVQPFPRRVRQESANATTETIMAGKYAKIAERGNGQYQCFVSNAIYVTANSGLMLRSFKEASQCEGLFQYSIFYISTRFHKDMDHSCQSYFLFLNFAVLSFEAQSHLALAKDLP